MAPGKPEAFVRFCRKFLRWHPHPKQEAFGQSVARTLLLACGIRFGKSDSLAPKHLHPMAFSPNGRFLNASFSEDQAKIVVLRAIEMAMSSPYRIFVEKVVKSPHLMLVLKNGATLQARSLDDANLLRGKSYDGISIDEAAFCSRENFDVMPGRVLDRDGWIAITSTPPPIKNWMFELWIKAQSEQMKGNPRYFAETGSTYDNPHIPRHVVDELREKYTELGFQREVMGEFVDNEGATFPLHIVDRAYKGHEIESERKKGGVYVSAHDLARKKALYASIALETSGPQMREVAWHRGSGIPWAEQCRMIEADQAKWDASTVIDGTGAGDVVDGMLNCAVTSFIFTPKSRAQGIIHMQKVFQDGLILLDPAHHQLRTQLLLHTWKEDAEDQTWDDFDALLMALWKANQMNATLGFSVLG